MAITSDDITAIISSDYTDVNFPTANIEYRNQPKELCGGKQLLIF